MRLTSRLLLGLTALATISASSAFAQGNNALQQQLQRRVQEMYRQQQDQQRQYLEAVQKNNQAAIKQYQDALKKRQQEYADQIKKLRESGVTDAQLLEMQRNSILAQLPKSKHSAMKRKWAREDRLRQMAVDRAKRTGKPVPTEAADGGLNLGGLDDLKLD